MIYFHNDIWDIVYKNYIEKSREKERILSQKPEKKKENDSSHKLFERLYSGSFSKKCSDTAVINAESEESSKDYIHKEYPKDRYDSIINMHRHNETECEKLNSLLSRLREVEALLREKESNLKSILMNQGYSEINDKEFISKLKLLGDPKVNKESIKHLDNLEANKFSREKKFEFIESIIKYIKNLEELLVERAEIKTEENNLLQCFTEYLTDRVFLLAEKFLIDNDLAELTKIDEDSLPLWCHEASIRDDIILAVRKQLLIKENWNKILIERRNIKLKIDELTLTNFIKIIENEIELKDLYLQFGISNFVLHGFEENIISSIYNSSWYENIGISSNLRYSTLINKELTLAIDSILERLAKCS